MTEPEKSSAETLHQKKYCEMCDVWFKKGAVCPSCGMPLRKGTSMKDAYLLDRQAMFMAACDECRLCGGDSRPAKSVAILPHGQRIKWLTTT